MRVPVVVLFLFSLGFAPTCGSFSSGFFSHRVFPRIFIPIGFSLRDDTRKSSKRFNEATK